MDDPTAARPCPRCGRPNRPEARFCRGCGAGPEALERGTAGAGAEATASLAEPASPIGQAWLPPPAEALVAGRFELLDSLGECEGVRRFRARDYGLCPICHDGPLPPEVDYCDWCGARLAASGPPPTVEIGLALDRAHLAPAEALATADGGFVAILRPAPAPATDVAGEPDALGVHLDVGYASDRGLVRPVNEDSVVVLLLGARFLGRAEPTMGLFVVADGVGGALSGDLASRRAAQAVAGHLAAAVMLPYLTDAARPLSEAVRDHVREAVGRANAAVHGLARERLEEVGCTLTAALVLDGQAFIAHVGDSRAYLFRAGQLSQLTTDHTLVAGLMAAGEITAAEAAVHPHRHVIYRALGSAEEVEVEQLEAGLRPGDALLLCTDGVWEPLGETSIGAALATGGTAQDVADTLVRLPRATGGQDNASVVAIRLWTVPPIEAAAPTPPTDHRREP